MRHQSINVYLLWFSNACFVNLSKLQHFLQQLLMSIYHLKHFIFS